MLWRCKGSCLFEPNTLAPEAKYYDGMLSCVSRARHPSVLEPDTVDVTLIVSLEPSITTNVGLLHCLPMVNLLPWRDKGELSRIWYLSRSLQDVFQNVPWFGRMVGSMCLSSRSHGLRVAYPIESYKLLAERFIDISLSLAGHFTIGLLWHTRERWIVGISILNLLTKVNKQKRCYEYKRMEAINDWKI